MAGEEKNKSDDIAIAALTGMVDFMKSHDLLDQLCAKVGVEPEFFKSKNRWEDVDFLELFYGSMYEVYLENKERFDPEFVASVSSTENFLAQVNKELVKSRNWPFFRFALSILVDPKMVWKRLPQMVTSTIRYSSVTYEHVGDTILYSTGRLIQTYKDPKREKINGWLSELCQFSIEGLAETLGTSLVYLKRTKSVVDGDEHCEFEFQWVRKWNPRVWLYWAASTTLLAAGFTYFVSGIHYGHGVAYSLLISTVLFLLINKRVEFGRTEDAFNQQRETIEELIDREKVQRKLNAELLKTQRELEKTVSLAVAGELSYGYLHDMSSAISIITMSTKLLNKKMEDRSISEKGGKYLSMVETATDRLVQMQNFIRKAIVNPNSNSVTVSQVNEPLSNVLDIIHPLAEDKHVDIKVNIDSTKDISIESVDGMIDGIVLNLMNNSLNALSEIDGGIIELNTGSQEESVAITIADNGPGIPDHVVEKMWYPFKGSGSGNEKDEIVSSGFGLYKIKRSVEKLGGDIRVETSSSGTKFTITLPVHGTSVVEEAA